MDSNFLESWVNSDDHRVLGRRLHPFCLHDILALELVDSPFLLGRGAGVCYHPIDLVLATRICSHAFESNVRWLRRNGRLKKVDSWLRLRHCKRDFEGECSAFTAYIDDYYAPPEIFVADDEGGHAIKSPWILAYATKLLTGTSMSENTIMSMPIGKVLWLSASMSELDGGGAEIVSPDEAAAIKELGYT